MMCACHAVPLFGAPDTFIRVGKPGPRTHCVSVLPNLRDKLGLMVRSTPLGATARVSNQAGRPQMRAEERSCPSHEAFDP
jgi:hypothetical protein